MAGALAALAAAAGVANAAELGRLETYPNPPELLYSRHNNDFGVRVRQTGGPWRQLFTWDAHVDLHRPQDATVAQFDFEGEVEVMIEKKCGDVSRVEVRPEGAGVRPRIVGGIVYLKLTQPQNLSVEFDGDRLHNLHILAGRPAEAPPPGPDVVVYGPGLHRPPDGAYFPVRSGQTIYVAGGAVLEGTFRLDGAENVRIYGRGIIDRPAEQLVVHRSRHVSIEGLTFLDSLHGVMACSQSSDVRFLDVKAFSAGQWSDGIDVFACDGVKVDRAFIRTSDDSIAVYATRKGAVGDTRNVSVTRSVFWPDVAHAMFVGLHGDTPSPDTLEHIAFSDIEALGLDEIQPEYQGVMAISAGDSNTVRDVTFSNIRVDRIQEGKLFNVRVVFNTKYNTSPGRAVENVVFRNIRYSGQGLPSPSLIAGYDAERRVRNVLLDDVRIGGRKLTGRGDQLEIGPFADGVVVR